MPVPAFVPLALKYGPAAYGLLKGIFGGKSKAEKAQEAAMARLQQVGERGLDPAILQRAIGILNARNQAEQGGVLSRLAAGNIDPSSGIAQELVGATRRGLGARQGEARSLFNEQSEMAKLRANEQLAGMNVPQDDSTGELLGSLLTNLSQEKFMQPQTKAPASVYDDLKMSPIPLETSPRGSISSPSPRLIQNFDPYQRAQSTPMSPRGLRGASQELIQNYSPFTDEQPARYVTSASQDATMLRNRLNRPSLLTPQDYVMNLRTGGANKRSRLSPLNPYSRY